MLVECLRAHQERRADRALCNTIVGIAVARVEAADESDHYLEVWETLRFALNPKALIEVQRQRLFRKHVLARVQRINDLLRVQRRRRHEKNGVDVGTRKHRRVFRKRVLDTERLLGPCALFVHRTASGDERRAGYATREILGVSPAHPTQAGDADAQRVFHFDRCTPTLAAYAATLCPLPPTGEQFAPRDGPAALIVPRLVSRATIGSPRRPARAL